MNEVEEKKGEEGVKEEEQGQRFRDDEGIDPFLFLMICPPGVGGRVGKWNDEGGRKRPFFCCFFIFKSILNF